MSKRFGYLNDHPGVAIVAAALSSALLVGCSSNGGNTYATTSNGYSSEYDRFADSVSLVDAKAVKSSTTGLSVTMLSYDQSTSDKDFDYLTHVYAPGVLDDLLEDVCRSQRVSGTPVAGMANVQFVVDGLPVEMRFSTSGIYRSLFGVNADYCQTGELKSVFMSGENLTYVPWLIEAKRSIHVMKNGAFSFETLPGFAMVAEGRGGSSFTSGLFVVRGTHQVQVPVSIAAIYGADELNAVDVYTPTYFDNPIR